MKNRRRIIVAFMLCAVMLLGIGYAAVTDALKIDGTAEINSGNVQSAFDANVYFSAAEVVGNAGGDQAWIDSVDNDIANFKSVNLAEQGNTAVFKFTIKNDSDLEVSVAPVLNYSGSEEAQTLAKKYFDVYSDWKNQETGVVATKTIAPGEEITYTVTVKLKETPALGDGGLLSSSFIINLTVTSVESMSY